MLFRSRIGQRFRRSSFPVIDLLSVLDKSPGSILTHWFCIPFETHGPTNTAPIRLRTVFVPDSIVSIRTEVYNQTNDVMSDQQRRSKPTAIVLISLCSKLIADL